MLNQFPVTQSIMSSAKKTIKEHWRRGTVNGHLSLICIKQHDRTARPAAPKHHDAPKYRPQSHQPVKDCALDPPTKAKRPKPVMNENLPVDRDREAAARALMSLSQGR